MPLSEFEMINHYFRNAIPARDDTLLGIGDDAALVTVAAGMTLTTVMLQWQPHLDYQPSESGDKVASALLHEAIKRLRQQQATPAWFTLSLSLPTLDEPWLKAFSEGLKEVSYSQQLDLIGGDSSRGPETLRLQLSGLRPEP